MAINRILSSAILFAVALQASASRGLNEADCEDDCVVEYEKCGGTNFTVSVPCCDPDLSCVAKNYYYAQCISDEKAANNTQNGWDGTVLECEEMPSELLPGPDDTGRKLLNLDCEDDECEPEFGKCGGGYNISTPCCGEEESCVIKNWYYAQCLTEDRANLNVANHGWDGRVLKCEEMPDDAVDGPDSWDWKKNDTNNETMRRAV